METIEIKPIAYIHTEFKEKFGVPRQSGLADTAGYIEFAPEFAKAEAVRGLEEFSHIWLIWEFSKTKEQGWSPTVRPPKLGGNVRKGVFATRSPFRPNPLGLSCVCLERIEFGEMGPRLYVRGADMVDGTPIFDIKPYVPYADSISKARGSFAQEAPAMLPVEFAAGSADGLSAEERTVLSQLLAQDPAPAYHSDAERVYGLDYADLAVRFRVEKGRITVVDIRRRCGKI